MAQTVTGTATFSRFSLLNLQVRALLSESGRASESSLDRVSRGLAPPHYIHEVAVRGVYPDGDLGAELRMVIDWRQHQLTLEAGGEVLQVPQHWQGNVAPSLIEAARAFDEAVTKARLSIEWVVTYETHFDRDSVNRELGFRSASRRKWRRPPDSLTLGLGPLGEGSLVASFAID